MKPATREDIEKYYAQRGLVEPNAVQSLMWLTTEVIELYDAYVRTVWKAMDSDPKFASQDLTASELVQYRTLMDVRTQLEKSLAERNPNWVRNQQDQRAPDLAGEIADVYMMLDRFAKEIGTATPAELLMNKLRLKGYQEDDTDAKE